MMKILEGLFKTKNEDRPMIETGEPTKGANITISDSYQNRDKHHQALLAAKSFCSKLKAELLLISKLEMLCNEPIIKMSHGLIKISHPGFEYINNGKPLTIIFDIYGEPLCAYFEEDKQ